MSKKIFINNLNTYVSKQLLDTLRNDEPNEDGEPNPDAAVIYGSYIDKDSSEKPAGVKKMLKRSKPRLAMKYLSECDLIVYDLHSGKPDDVRLALDALQKHKGEEGDEKVLILISSLMAWQGTPRKQEEIKTAEQIAADRAEADAAAKLNEDGDAEPKEEGSDVEQKEPSEKGSDEENKNEEQGEDEVEEIVVEKVRKRYRHLPFSELDYKTRDPIEEYKIIRDIEDEVLSFKREGVKCYVISAGILYGNGEAIFNSHFKKAWLQDPLRLPYVGDGNNFLPTIHVKDLAGMVKKISESKPERKYIFAVDNNKKPTQKKIVSAISNGIGTGLVESIDIPEVFKVAHPKVTPIQLDLDWKKSLLLDLKVTPSSLFISGKEEPAPGDDEPAEEEGDILAMEWHCKSGLPENIQLVKKEFEKQHKHRPIKILIAGPPASGKSFFGQQMAEHFNVPHIHMLKLIADLESWDQEKEDKYQKRETERQYKIDLIRQERAAEKERKRLEAEATKAADEEKNDDDDNGDAGEDGDAPPKEPGEEDGEAKEDAAEEVKEEVELPIIVEMDGDSDDDFSLIEIKEKVKQFKASHSGRLPENLISEMVQWRLERNDCQNRGYVLDGYPRNFHQANQIFVKTPELPKQEKDEEGELIPYDEEVLAKNKPTLLKEIYPESVISLNASKQFLMKRSKMLQQKLKDDATKWRMDRMHSKFLKHQEDNSIDLFKGDNGAGNHTYPTTKFFQDYKTEIFELQADANKYEMFESMRVYVERFGRPYNYLKSMQQLNDEREKYLLEEERQSNEVKKHEEEVSRKEEEDKKLALEGKSVARLSSVASHMQELESADELNMRQYAMKYIIPLLTEGMIDVWKVGPLDPVDYLAEYIFKKSGEAA